MPASSAACAAKCGCATTPLPALAPLEENTTMCHRCIRSSLRSLPTRRKARGAATLIVALTLLGGMLLVLVAANRGLLLELRMATNQVRATTAFEAAEAGLEWATAQLNSPEPIGRN